MKKKSNIQEFKFTEPENLAVFTCDHVLNGDRAILFVSHDHDGDWQFLCGQRDHTGSNPKIISIFEATQLDPTINELYEMPTGVGAKRENIGDKWRPFRLME